MDTNEPQEEVTTFFALTPDNAEEFFNRCLEKEAVTEKERLEIMADLIKEHRVLAAGTLEPKVGEACKEYFKKTNRRGVIFLKENKNVSESDNDNS